MGAGHRILRDLALYHATAHHQQIETAKAQFRSAGSVAADLGSSDLLIAAELAITGCWYRQHSLDGVRATLDAALTVAETNVLLGERAVVNRYAQVLTLCRTFGVVTTDSVIPIDPAHAPPPGRRAHRTRPARPLGGPVEQVPARHRGRARRRARPVPQPDHRPGDRPPPPLSGEPRAVNRALDIYNGAPVTDAYLVNPDANATMELRLLHPSTARLAVTVALPVAWGRPGAQVGPSLAFLLPPPGQARQQVQPGHHGHYLLPPGHR